MDILQFPSLAEFQGIGNGTEAEKPVLEPVLTYRIYSGTLHAQPCGVAEPFILESPYKWNGKFSPPALLLYKTLQDIN